VPPLLPAYILNCEVFPFLGIEDAAFASSLKNTFLSLFPAVDWIVVVFLLCHPTLPFGAFFSSGDEEVILTLL